ncbi:MAG TPA: RNA polymerase factor sigma-32 [Alphaproteobacteria bacterium]
MATRSAPVSTVLGDAAGALVRLARRQPMLSREEERDLARRARRGDRDAVSRLVKSHLRLVIGIAERYRAPGLHKGDLIQEGCIGLMQALQRFNPDHEARLATYARLWIKSAIQDHVVRSWSLVRLSTSTAQKSLFFNLRRMRAALSETGESLSESAVRHVAAALNQTEAEVRRMARRLVGPDLSLDVAAGDQAGASSWVSQLADDAPTPEDAAIRRDETRRWTGALAAALGELRDRERLVIRRRYLSDVATTLEGLGRELGISKERVRQIEARAMAKLRRILSQRVGEQATV